ncbi:uncharacterized protein BDR25DRAFT_359581 [Lindgomyces ingoldianus]|uniref:Uncharacterized protein n=1 Tax=Lindgomyces ingoldianus TaxID=673940 RepID=A0ACB6QIR2_9PLEO|nr:uncharacterized protein BDR25DRAFT_359581 [Lindgomyces ingoldianus]KAF2466212.1 hypothetical protein BDR25DRAFT_359581 [Lindgomyces ingoldianus]
MASCTSFKIQDVRRKATPVAFSFQEVSIRTLHPSKKRQGISVKLRKSITTGSSLNRRTRVTIRFMPKEKIIETSPSLPQSGLAIPFFGSQNLFMSNSVVNVKLVSPPSVSMVYEFTKSWVASSASNIDAVPKSPQVGEFFSSVGIDPKNLIILIKQSWNPSALVEWATLASAHKIDSINLISSGLSIVITGWVRATDTIVDLGVFALNFSTGGSGGGYKLNSSGSYTAESVPVSSLVLTGRLGLKHVQITGMVGQVRSLRPLPDLRDQVPSHCSHYRTLRASLYRLCCPISGIPSATPQLNFPPIAASIPRPDVYLEMITHILLCYTRNLGLYILGSPYRDERWPSLGGKRSNIASSSWNNPVVRIPLDAIRAYVHRDTGWFYPAVLIPGVFLIWSLAMLASDIRLPSAVIAGCNDIHVVIFEDTHEGLLAVLLAKVGLLHCNEILVLKVFEHGTRNSDMFLTEGLKTWIAHPMLHSAPSSNLERSMNSEKGLVVVFVVFRKRKLKWTGFGKSRLCYTSPPTCQPWMAYQPWSGQSSTAFYHPTLGYDREVLDKKLHPFGALLASKKRFNG